MAKRILAIILLITFLLSLSACNRPVEDVGGAVATETNQTSGETSATTAEATTTETETTPQTEPATKTTAATTVTTARPTTTVTTTKPSTTTTVVQEPVIVGDHDNFTTLFDTTTGVLTVSGKGVVEDVYPRHQNDLEEYDNVTVKKVIIEEGITYIKNSFNHLCMLESIQLPSTLHTIEKSFIECGNTYQKGGQYVDVTIPATVKKIFNQSFQCTGFENLIFEGPVEIGPSEPFKFAYFRKDKKLIISSGSVLCNAFDYSLRLREIVLEPGVIFCNHTSHSPELGGNSFEGVYDWVKVYACAPVYMGEEIATVESLSNHFSDWYLPLIVPEGEAIENYHNQHVINEYYPDTGFYNEEMAVSERKREFAKLLPQD